MLWLPSIICILGAKLQDLYQLVPIIVQLSFLVTPILYFKKELGSLQFLSMVNPIYQIIAPLREVLLSGELLFLRDMIVFSLMIMCQALFTIHLLVTEEEHLQWVILKQ